MRVSMWRSLGLVTVGLWCASVTGDDGMQNEDRKMFEQADSGPWRETFSDGCTGDWKAKWFLDGEIASVTTSEKGMQLTAGPQFKNDAHHSVLWTKDSFDGDLRIEYEYTQPDYLPKGLFKPGVPHTITVIKKARDLFMRIKNAEQVYYCHMTNPKLPVITEGRIGLRHMFTRSARYKNIRVSVPAE